MDRLRRQEPKISVVMPVFNGAEFLAPAVESVLGQTEADFELVAVDDGSRDGSRDLLAGFARRDERVRVIRQDHGGIVTALNRGLAEARGRYVARMDADDVSHPDRLRLASDYLGGNPGIGLVGSRVSYLGDAQRNRGLAVFVEWTNSLLSPEDIDLYRFVETPFIHPSVMFRRELPSRFGGYREGSFPEDYELWLRWMDAGVRMAKLDQTLLKWRERPGRLTRTDPRYSVEAFYETKAPYLYRWLERHNPHHPEVAVWGSGRESRKRLRALTRLGVRVSTWVDIDPKKIGYRIEGAEVVGPDRLPPPTDCFVLSWVSSRGARAEIERALARHGYEPGRHYLPCA